MSEHGEPTASRISRAELDSLVLDAQRVGQPDTQYAQTIFKRSVLGAVQTICDLALIGSSERIRLQAATYVVERVLGRIQDNPPKNDDEPFDALMAECVSSIPDAEFNRIRTEMEGS